MFQNRLKNNKFSFRKKKMIKDENDCFLKKLGNSFLLTSVLMIIGGVIRGIGLLIVNIVMQSNVASDDNVALKVGKFIDSIGAAIFTFMPIFYAVSIAIFFTKDKSKRGFSALSAIVGYVILTSFQPIFIKTSSTINGEVMYSVLFYKNLNGGLLIDIMGFHVLNTSVVSGILCGALAAMDMNRYGNKKLPKLLVFFEKERIAIIISLVGSFVLSLMFIIIWPSIGLLLLLIGHSATNAPYGIESLIYGMVERALIPTGMNNVLNMIFQFTAAGGTLDANFLIDYHFNGQIYHTLMDFLSKNNLNLATEMKNNGNAIVGDQNIWFFIEKTHIPFDVFANRGFKPGHFMNGRFPYMLFGLIGVCLAIALTSEVTERKRILNIMLSSALVTFITGTTIPIEFSFIFIAPWLFYFVHVPIVMIDWWLMNIFDSHVGLAFSGGLIDYVIFGAIPDIFNLHVNCWIPLVIGIINFPIYFFLFYFLIKRFNVPTPGREMLKGLSKKEIKIRTANKMEDWIILHIKFIIEKIKR